jgi:hypothetical protein
MTFSLQIQPREKQKLSPLEDEQVLVYDTVTCMCTKPTGYQYVGSAKGSGVSARSGLLVSITTPFYLPLTPLANSHPNVNEISRNQNQSDYLTKAPRVLARLDDGTIAMDLEASMNTIPVTTGDATHDQLQCRDAIYRRSDKQG